MPRRPVMRDAVRGDSVVGDVCGPIVIRSAFVGRLVLQSRRDLPLGRGATQVGNALRRALVECIALALEPRHRRRIGVARPNVQLFTILAGLVGVEEAEVLIQTLVDRRGSCAAGGCERDKARQTRAKDNAGILHSHFHVQATSPVLFPIKPSTSEPIGLVQRSALLTGRSLLTDFDFSVFPCRT